MSHLHPPFVHFIIALPVAALFSQLTFLATRDRTYSNAATRILALSLLLSFLALYGGYADAQKIVKGNDILKEGLRLLESHKTFGIIVVVILAATTALKWVAGSKESLFMEKLSLLFIIVTILASLYQGNHGGMLVYKYSAGIDGKIIDKRVEEMNSRP
ncbi:hypothetical protein NNO_1019 [Hydrogenimonas sp.]|nr:hypothetical protein NNO_1019 [Hydrogenimonas sp.]